MIYQDPTRFVEKRQAFAGTYDLNGVFVIHYSKEKYQEALDKLGHYCTPHEAAAAKQKAQDELKKKRKKEGLDEL